VSQEVELVPVEPVEHPLLELKLRCTVYDDDSIVVRRVSDSDEFCITISDAGDKKHIYCTAVGIVSLANAIKKHLHDLK